MAGELLRVQDLRISFNAGDSRVTVVDGVDLEIAHGETVALVGESGCGKSMTSLAVMGLVPDLAGKKVSGGIFLEGEPLLSKPPRQMREIRGKSIAMIFQEPMTSLNPVFTCGSQIVEGIRRHRKISAQEAKGEAVEMLSLVGIPMPEKRFGEYPHQMSGGMRQRVMIAMALSSRPKLLIADEPTTALDVTIQAQILDLLRKLHGELGMATLLITHDLGIVAEMVERVVVMYAGCIVEEASCADIFEYPMHPYTRGLLRSLPKLDVREDELYVIPGSVPVPGQMPEGCKFHPRCEYAMDRCGREKPALRGVAGRKAACWLHGEGVFNGFR